HTRQSAWWSEGRCAWGGTRCPTAATCRSSRRLEPDQGGNDPMTDDSEARFDEAAKGGMTAAHWAAEQPDAPAIVSPLGDRTFAELNANANRLVRALRERGVRAGDAVAVMVANRPEFAEVLAATVRSGLRFTPINLHLTADEAADIVRDWHARVL